jgi:hypothetical protein
MAGVGNKTALARKSFSKFLGAAGKVHARSITSPLVDRE